MLRKPETYTYEERVEMVLRGYVAWDKEAECHLYKSHGHQASGHAPHWTVTWDAANPTIGYGYFHLTAWTLDEAITRANKRLARGDLKREPI